MPRARSAPAKKAATKKAPKKVAKAARKAPAKMAARKAHALTRPPCGAAQEQTQDELEPQAFVMPGIPATPRSTID